MAVWDLVPRNTSAGFADGLFVSVAAGEACLLFVVVVGEGVAVCWIYTYQPLLSLWMEKRELPAGLSRFSELEVGSLSTEHPE